MDKTEVIDFGKDLIIIVVIVLLIRTFLAMPFQINGQSMYSSYYNREFIIVDRLSYRLGEVKRGDVIVFKPEVSNERKYFLKRVLGLPGDKLKIEDGKIFLKKPNSDDFIEIKEGYLDSFSKGFTYVNSSKAAYQYSLGKNQYFVLGDNRNNSTDSRECFMSCALEGSSNFISKEDITGKIFVDLGYFNFRTFSFMQPELGINTKPKFFYSPSSYDY